MQLRSSMLATSTQTSLRREKLLLLQSSVRSVSDSEISGMPPRALTSPHLNNPAIIWVSAEYILKYFEIFWIYFEYILIYFVYFVHPLGRSPTVSNFAVFHFDPCPSGRCLNMNRDHFPHENFNFGAPTLHIFSSCGRWQILQNKGKPTGFGLGSPESISWDTPVFRQNAPCLSLSPVPLGGGRDSELWTLCCICHTQSWWCGWTWHRTVTPTIWGRDWWFFYLVGYELAATSSN